ncbi:MAG: Ada metal-binding domain-containing protein [Candidatus Hodarchaeota archaeon]
MKITRPKIGRKSLRTKKSFLLNQNMTITAGYIVKFPAIVITMKYCRKPKFRRSNIENSLWIPIMEKLAHDVMLKARLTRDATYDGKFYIGVRTMKIFCIPSCKAKIPRKENMVFFSDREEAIIAGYRGCQRCKAAQYPNIAPTWLEDILTLMGREVNRKIPETELAQIAKADITTIRRYFKSHFQLTPIAFHRKLRLKHAKMMIEKGIDCPTAASKCGFKSYSGFRDAFVREYGLLPGEYSNASRTNHL